MALCSRGGVQEDTGHKKLGKRSSRQTRMERLITGGEGPKSGCSTMEEEEEDEEEERKEDKEK